MFALLYRGIPTHRNKCSLRIRNIVFGPEVEVNMALKKVKNICNLLISE
jgi:hypothetical protein